MAVGICQVPSLRFCVLIRGFDNHSLESKKSKIINITTGGNGFSIIAPPVKFKRSFQWSRLTEDNIERGGGGGGGDLVTTSARAFQIAPPRCLHR